MGTKLTVLADNIAANGMEGEWGLSILVEHKESKVLVDSGATPLFLDNLKSLGYNPLEINKAILSHAHHDHSDGFDAYLKFNKNAKLYVRDECDENCYVQFFHFFHKYIGIKKGLLDKYQNQIVRVKEHVYKLEEDIYLISHSTPNLYKNGKRESMVVKGKDNKYTFDDFKHEQSLVIDSSKGLIIINSCSHGGIINIINEVKEVFPDKHIHALVGGFHLFNKSKKEIINISKQVKNIGIDYLYTGHCTKNRAFSIMKKELNDMVNQFKVGLTIEF